MKRYGEMMRLIREVTAIARLSVFTLLTNDVAFAVVLLYLTHKGRIT